MLLRPMAQRKLRKLALQVVVTSYYPILANNQQFLILAPAEASD